jgi:hypothetical protein
MAFNGTFGPERAEIWAGPYKTDNAPKPQDTPEIQYKFNEAELIEELMNYIDSTYKQHYAGDDRIQTNEFVIKNGDGVGAMRHSIYKYIQRYGHKDGRNRKDLLKALHYALLLLYVHDYETQKGNQ